MTPKHFYLSHLASPSLSSFKPPFKILMTISDNLTDEWTRVWHSYGFWYERISEYIRVKKMTRTNIRIYSYDIFWHERISEYIRIRNLIRTNIRIDIRIQNIQIFEYFGSEYLFGYSFVSIFLYEYIRRFIRVKKFIRIYSDIRSCQKI